MTGDLALAFERSRRDRPPPTAPNDRDRFEQMLDRHHRRLTRVVAGVIADPSGVEDVLQDAYLKAYRRLPRRFANEAHEAVWLYRVVYRCAVDELRRRSRRHETARPELHVVERARPDVQTALRALAPTERAVLLLVDLIGFSYEEAADVLRIPRGTVASRLHAARAHFRGAIDA